VYTYSGGFPEQFVWGVGTAAYQVEGAYRADGRGASIWDTFTGADTIGMPGANCSYCCKKVPCPINPSMGARGATGNVACDHYHLWRSDIALMQSMGIRHYRFSISWSRLVPTGKVADGVNPEGRKFYNNLIDGLLNAGITPFVTLYHWDLPQGLLDPPRVNGWWSKDPQTGQPNGEILQDWLDYVDICFSEFGDRVKMWVTFNEAWSFTFLANGMGKAPNLFWVDGYHNQNVDPYVAAHNVLNAHAAAVDLYRRKYKRSQGGIIGITNNCDWREPASALPVDVAAAERTVEFQLGWFSDPIFGGTGDYSQRMRQFLGDRLPKFTAEQRRLLNGSADFFGLNHYGTSWAKDSSSPGDDSSYAHVFSTSAFVRAQSFWLHGSGWGFRKMLNWVHRRYGGPPIYVTEGGWSLPAGSPEEGAADAQRLLYYANYTAEMRRAIYEDGVDVRGYFAWSLLDNFEWERGYSERFGTVYTDYAFGWDAQSPTNKNGQPTAGRQIRRRKQSSCWLEAVWRGNALVDPADEDHRCVGSEIFHGSYVDPRTSICAHNISVDGNGVAGNAMSFRIGDGTACNGTGEPSEMSVRLSGGTIIADFSAEGGPSQLIGYWNRRINGINWGDGRTWVLVPGARLTTSTTSTTIPSGLRAVRTTTSRNLAQHSARIPWLILCTIVMYSCFFP
jgi:beta-glucosidase/6-phospho-beta-glucosidase/beta-galactosidase